jgi:hypothetical protein
MWLHFVGLGDGTASETPSAGCHSSLNRLNANDYIIVTDHLIHRWQKCVGLGGD